MGTFVESCGSRRIIHIEMSPAVVNMVLDRWGWRRWKFLIYINYDVADIYFFSVNKKTRKIKMSYIYSTCLHAIKIGHSSEKYCLKSAKKNFNHSIHINIFICTYLQLLKHCWASPVQVWRELSRYSEVLSTTTSCHTFFHEVSAKQIKDKIISK